MTNRTAIIVMLAATAGLGACKSRAPADLPPVASASTQNPNALPGTGEQYGAEGPGSQVHFDRAVQGRTTIYFDTDRYNIDSQDTAILQAQAQYLAQYPNVSVTLEGHTDERGTREYNLALGERRANAAKNYLASLGVPASRIRTVSYGKERPIAMGSNEQAWAQNRRAVTIVLN